MSANLLLPLFKEQLEGECATLMSARELNRGGALLHWYFGRIHGFTEAEIVDIQCDGSNDLGIDGIWIDDDDDDVFIHFYQFKNPEKANKGFAGNDVDVVISGLQLILHGDYQKVSNPELRQRIEEVRQQAPKGYRLHLVCSGQGIQLESRLKLDTFVEQLGVPANAFVCIDEPLEHIHDQFYQRTAPAVEDPIKFALRDGPPYMVESAAAGSYFFHVPGSELASLYHQHREKLLQRNIRVWQKDTATNRSIQETCSGSESANFLHYNNGVTFICESASWMPFAKMLVLQKGQVVNGGQTIRALDRAREAGELKDDVLVPVRVIESRGNKEFASNVAINQNNQNQMGTGFLRSNDPGIVQLGHALESKGWYLERREGELETMADPDKAAILARIRPQSADPLDMWTIRLKEGAQAYVATFYEQPELAKKNVKKIFLSTADGGSFETIFSTDLTAEKMVTAHQISAYIAEFVSEFVGAKNRKRKNPNGDWVIDYQDKLGHNLWADFSDEVEQVVPQSAVFLCGTVFQDLTKFQGIPHTRIRDHLAENGDPLLQSHLHFILEYGRDFPHQKGGKSWPTLLKSNAFFKQVVSYIGGIRRPTNGHDKPTKSTPA